MQQTMQQRDLKAAAARVLTRNAATASATARATEAKKVVARAFAEKGRMQQPASAVLATLDRDPTLRYAWLTDSEASSEYIVLVGAIRDAGTFELSIPRDRYDVERLAEVLGLVEGERTPL